MNIVDFICCIILFKIDLIFMCQFWS